MAQLGAWILPLKIKSGRCVREPPNERLCTRCNQHVIENELHFVLDCQLYNQCRIEIFDELLYSPELLDNERQYVFRPKTVIRI